MEGSIDDVQMKTQPSIPQLSILSKDVNDNQTSLQTNMVEFLQKKCEEMAKRADEEV